MQAVWKLSKYIKPYILFAIIAPVMMVIEVSMDLLQPTILQHIIDDGIAQTDTSYIVKMFGLMIATSVIGLIGGIGCSIYASRTAVNFSTDLRQDLYETITYFSNSSKDKFTLGKLVTNLTSDMEMLQRALTMLLKVFVRGPMMFIGAIVIVFITARELFPILLVVVPILAFCMYYFTALSGKLFHKVQKVVDMVNTKVQENLAGIRVIKAYNRKNHQIEQFTEVNTQLMKRSMAADQIIGVLAPLTMFVVNLGIVAALWMGAIKVDNNTLQVGVILAFINYLMMVMQGLMSSSMVLVQLARAIPSAGRIVEVLEENTDLTSPLKPEIKQIQGSISFENVSFSYLKETESVLKNISFHVNAGETVGIIGMTGSGKSTLVKMIPRLFDPDSGSVKIDGVPIGSYSLEHLRQSIGFSPQKATLFSKTIADNLRYGKSDATSEDIVQALQSANAKEFVDKLDAGTEHLLTQGATNLSGGQKQRLAMARSFIRKPSILILDDVTSAVDSISEKTIQRAIEEQFSDATKVIVSSKISSIRHADQILVMDDGKIAAQGTHEQLLQESILYQEMAKTQAEKGVTLSE
ncbi:putative multidrug resistance ABC transporter ATP-binding/permease protein YheI [Solibacillus isronensis B3W22]|uniref:Putative multidrug resistance ABC transporter ATP-binding/permease protein YheI n=1 Tax=Solibacillus isronensis B3W22 TaxID=1224748 RepID=K1KKI6_9BACL|nr:ABC transporter ATP-binding protein [Solibacillus isronensis]AMO87272.1 multidrug ABC transporter ATP-binding protein [Solibacillus silvestris]EKB44605.1 putative multidrug resistance ABC transporter ATP-binding/permease protein YheI [Solibacillus isronensis B3W22]